MSNSSSSSHQPAKRNLGPILNQIQSAEKKTSEIGHFVKLEKRGDHIEYAIDHNLNNDQNSILINLIADQKSDVDMAIIAAAQFSFPHVKPDHEFTKSFLFKWATLPERIGTAGSGQKYTTYYIGLFKHGNTTFAPNFTAEINEGCYRYLADSGIISETSFEVKSTGNFATATKVWFAATCNSANIVLCISVGDLDGNSHILSVPITGKSVKEEFCGGYDLLGIKQYGSFTIKPNVKPTKPDPRGFGPFPKDAIQGPQPPNIKLQHGAEKRKLQQGLYITVSPNDIPPKYSNQGQKIPPDFTDPSSEPKKKPRDGDDSDH